MPDVGCCLSPLWWCTTALQAVPISCHVRGGKRTLNRASTSIPVLPTFALIVRHVSPRGDAHPLPVTSTPWILPAERSEVLPSTVTCTGREEIRRGTDWSSAALSRIPSCATRRRADALADGRMFSALALGARPLSGEEIAMNLWGMQHENEWQPATMLSLSAQCVCALCGFNNSP